MSQKESLRIRVGTCMMLLVPHRVGVGTLKCREVQTVSLAVTQNEVSDASWLREIERSGSEKSAISAERRTDAPECVLR